MAVKKDDKGRFDPKEIEFPDTVYERDIENRVFQSIIVHCLSAIAGVRLIEGGLMDQFLRRSAEGVKGIYAEQDEKTHSVNVKVEVNVVYGVSIPEKAEEIQSRVVEAITRLTGLHVGRVHVVFRNVVAQEEVTPSSEGAS